MQSHTYDLTGRQALRVVFPILVTFFGCIIALRLADRAGFFPSYTDDAGIHHQVRAAHSRHPAQIVFVGDSTCWCGIDAKGLSEQLPGQIAAINLSLLIWFDLGRYAQQTAAFAKANPGQVKWVVLLVCSGKISRNLQSPDQAALWRDLAEEQQGPQNFWEQDDLYASKLIHGRLAPLILPQALHKRGAGYWGFTSELSAFMTAHDGGLFDIGEYVPLPNQKISDNLHLAPQFEQACRDFRAKMAPGVKLAIGLTPGVLGTAPPDSHEHFLACLQQWKVWIQADLALTNLPELLPTPCFAPGGHLNAYGQKIFTSAVAKELSPALH